MSAEAETNSPNAAPRLDEIPPRELERWECAPPHEQDGTRMVNFQFCTPFEITCTFPWFIEHVTDRLDQWKRGRYKPNEAAQVISEAYPGEVDARSFLKQLKRAIRQGSLAVRKNGIPVEMADLSIDGVSLPANPIIEARDLNEWLANEGSPYRLAYPYDEPTHNGEEGEGESLAPTHSNEQTVASEADIRENRNAALANQPRGAKGLILEHWDKVEARYGPQANGRQVLRVLGQFLDGADKMPELKTIQNHLSALREAKLIP
jgi:hypothetical protein